MSTTKIVIDYDGVDGSGDYNDDFNITFQVIHWRSGHYLSAKTIAFDCVFKANH